jgi:16S rRNA (cytosine967-C5)-methyltransferase
MANTMTPGARIQSAIEIIDLILEGWSEAKRIPADKVIEHYTKARRYIGSKDRGAIAELTYWVLRHKAALEWWLAHENESVSGRMLVLAALMLRREYTPQTLAEISQDSTYSFGTIYREENTLLRTLAKRPLLREDMPDHVRLNYPEWLDAPLKAAFGEHFEAALLSLNEQAPTDLRVNTLKTTREALVSLLRTEGFECDASAFSPVGVRLAKRAPIFTSKAFKDGWFEVQDEGSQAVAQLVDARPGHRVIDFCAGAGGKTLAIAASMENKGRILAWDTSKKRLDQINERMRRAGVHNVQAHVLESESDAFIKRHKQTADRVLIDVPCSGTGTWRRNPDLKWRFTPQDLAEVTAVQRSILDSASRLVKPGGRLIYATCSILKEENDLQIERFLTENKHFRVVCAQKIWDKAPPAEENEQEANAPVSYFSVNPHEDGVDGFFAAVMIRVG